MEKVKAQVNAIYEGMASIVSRINELEESFNQLPALAKAELKSNSTIIPNFNSDDLMKHPWKGKKLAPGEYSEGSLSWGWDFINKFTDETISVLEKGPQTIDGYTFSLNETHTLVSAKKA